MSKLWWKNGYVTGRPLVGVAGSDITFMASKFYGLPQGIYVTAVSTTSDAYTQGLREGDIIVKIGDSEITTVSQGCAVRNNYAVGDKVTLTLYRKGSYYKLEITLAEQTADSGNYNF